VLTGVATTLGSSIPVGYNIGVMNTPAHVREYLFYALVVEYLKVKADDNTGDENMRVIYKEHGFLQFHIFVILL
jgi:hypothetical protein